MKLLLRIFRAAPLRIILRKSHIVHASYRARLCNRRVSHFETSPALPCPRSVKEKGEEKKKEMHMVTRPGSTWPALISSDNAGR